MLGYIPAESSHKFSGFHTGSAHLPRHAIDENKAFHGMLRVV
jgi:hypothetical protein